MGWEAGPGAKGQEGGGDENMVNMGSALVGVVRLGIGMEGGRRVVVIENGGEVVSEGKGGESRVRGGEIEVTPQHYMGPLCCKVAEGLGQGGEEVGARV